MKEKTIEILKNKFNSNGARLNYIQDIVRKSTDLDEQGVNNFFIQLNREADECEGSDFWIIGGDSYDWKEFEKIEVLDSMLNLVEARLNSKALDLFYKNMEVA